MQQTVCKVRDDSLNAEYITWVLHPLRGNTICESTRHIGIAGKQRNCVNPNTGPVLFRSQAAGYRKAVFRLQEKGGGPSVQMTEGPEKTYSFTLKAWNNILGASIDDSFFSMEADVIFRALSRSIRVVPFHEYLKRYLYEKTEIPIPFSDVPIQEYQDMIEEAFHETGTPCSFSPVTTRVHQAIRNWLIRDDITRESVLLLGFGLYMTEEDVNAFLTKALHGARLDPDDPLEAICLYCYRHEYKFAKFLQLKNLYDTMDTAVEKTLIIEHQPENRPQSRHIIEEDTELLASLLERKKQPGLTPVKNRTVNTFKQLYEDAQQMLSHQKNQASSFTGPRALEKVLSAAVPTDANGNLVRETQVQAFAEFARKRISRQRIHRILSGAQLPNRYDLLTLKFFILSDSLMHLSDRKEAMNRFIEETNQTLISCGFGKIYPADPFDAFLLLCMLTCDPMGSYSDVMETAYSQSCPKKGGNEPWTKLL